MNVLFVSEYYPFYAAKVVHEIAKRLVKQGCSTAVLSSNIKIGSKTRMSVFQEEFIDDVRVIRFDSFSTAFVSTPYIISNPLIFPRLWKFLEQQVDANDIVHLHTGHGLLNLSTAICHKLSSGASTLVYTSHGIPRGYDSPILEAASVLAKKIVKRFIINSCVRMTAVGLRDIDYWAKQGVPVGKMRYIPNGVDTKTFHPSNSLRQLYREKLGYSDEEIVVLFLAQFRKSKGIDVLVNAVPKVISENKQVRFLLAGTGPMLDVVKSLIKALNLTNHVRLLPYYIPDEELPDLFNACDFYVLPSSAEGMPLSLMEAMACGKPVIATHVGDVPYLVQNESNGALIPPNQVDTLTYSIINLADNPEIRTQMGKENVKKMAEYDWDKIADKYYSLYLEARDSQWTNL